MNDQRISELKIKVKALKAQGQTELAKEMEDLIHGYLVMAQECKRVPIRVGMRASLLPDGADIAEFAINSALRSSYDGRYPHDNVSLAATAVLDDLSTRRGLNDVLRSVEFDVKFEITDAVEAIIRRAINGTEIKAGRFLFSNKEESAEETYRKALKNLAKNVAAYKQAQLLHGAEHEEAVAAFESLVHAQESALDLIKEPLYPTFAK